jgi:hypothetical protein
MPLINIKEDLRSADGCECANDTREGEKRREGRGGEGKTFIIFAVMSICILSRGGMDPALIMTPTALLT